MEFRKELNIKKSLQQINIHDKIMLVGSCFTEHLGEKLKQSGFNTNQNPNGILFNPISIAESIKDYIDNKRFTDKEIFYFDEWWMSWKHHNRYIHQDQNSLLNLLNKTTEEAHEFLKNAQWLIITLGSAWVYQIDNGQIVANCHKIPSERFQKRILTIEELSLSIEKVISELKEFNSSLKIIFTISPVRHLRDGYVENNRSKALLIHCTHYVVEKFENVFYFPAYELVMDDLRDYRFFSEDMVHPNHLATDYVWEKFNDCFIDEISSSIIKEIQSIKTARAHKSLHPNSISHQRFLKSLKVKTELLKQQYPFLDLTDELDYFSDLG